MVIIQEQIGQAISAGRRPIRSLMRPASMTRGLVSLLYLTLGAFYSANIYDHAISNYLVPLKWLCLILLASASSRRSLSQSSANSFSSANLPPALSLLFILSLSVP